MSRARELFNSIAPQTFPDLTDAQRELLFEAFIPERYSAGDQVYARRPDRLFLVLSGAVFIDFHDARGLAWPHLVLRRGKLFGERAVLPLPADPQVLPEPASTAEAITDLRLLTLDLESYQRVAERVTPLRQIVRDLTLIRPLGGPCLSAICESGLFGHVSPHALIELFSEAERLRACPANIPMGLYFIGPGTEGEGKFSAGTLLPHFGNAPLEPLRQADYDRRTVVHVPVDRLRGLLSAIPALRRAQPQADFRRMLIPSEAQQPLEVVMLRSDAKVPVESLTPLLAQAIVSNHGDRVVILRLGNGVDVSRPAPEPAGPAGRRGGLLRYQRANVGPGQPLLPAVRAAVDGLRGRCDYLFIHPDPELRQSAQSELDPVITKVVFLTSDPLVEVPVGFNEAGFTHRVVISLLPEATTGWESTPRFSSVFPRGAVRLPLEPALFADSQRQPPRMDTLTPQQRDAFNRWARAVTDRRVGLALGGGGVFGYAHVSLMTALARMEVPIDMISGVSFGSLVGAYFCAERETGLARIRSSRRSLSAAAQLSLLTSRALSSFVDLELGSRRLEELTVPLFPVATEITTGTSYVVRAGTLGFGVRASSAAPGVFTPVTDTNHRLIDGGVVNNVPEATVAAAGANLIIASNVLAELPPREVEAPLLPFRAGRAVFEGNLYNRSRDVLRSLFVLLRDGGGQDAWAADVVFAPANSDAEIWDFASAETIIRNTESAAYRTAERALLRWQSMQARGA